MSSYFLKLIETVNAQKGILFRDGIRAQIHPEWSDLFAMIVDDIEVFVFAPRQDYPIDLVDPEDKHIDAPFKNFSFEVLGKCLTVSRPDEPVCNTECLVAHEYLPNKFIFFVLWDIDNRSFVFGEDSESEIGGGLLLGLVKEFTSKLAREAIGTERTSERIKFRYKGEKKLIKLKRIIHITPKTQKERYVQNTSRQVDWTYRWTQRGHWRDLGSDSLGKDRNGVYCIQGKTWVSESVKGPKDKPLIKKVRLVKDLEENVD